MLDALEEAESAYERQAAARQAQAQTERDKKLAALRAAAGSQAGAAAEAAAAAAAATAQLPPVAPLLLGLGLGSAGAGERLPDTPRKAAICEGTRERMVQAVFEALQLNPRWVLLGPAGGLTAVAGTGSAEGWLGRRC